MNETTTSARSILLFLGVIDRPRTTLANVLAHPRGKWLLPLVLCLAATIFMLWATADEASVLAARQQAVALQSMQGQLQDMTQAQQQQLRDQMARFSSPSMLMLIGSLTSAIGLLLSWLIGAAMIYFGLTIGGTELRFPPLLAALSWTWLPFAFRDLFSAVWNLITGVLMVNPGLSYFVSTGDTLSDQANPLWLLASQVDLFWLWHLVLIYALVKAVRPQHSAWGLTLLYALLYLAVRVGPAALLGRLV
ncbi:MAG: YIP1 family protein [Anaerolineae bacterium]